MKASVGLYSVFVPLTRGRLVSFSGTEDHWITTENARSIFFTQTTVCTIYILDEAAFAAGDLNKSSLENMSQL